MSRDYRLYLEDMREALDRISRYVAARSYEEFAQDELLVDGVVRNLELIGEGSCFKKTEKTKKMIHNLGLTR